MNLAELLLPEEQPLMHLTVMRSEVVRALAPQAGGLYLDCTAGGGGHAAALLEAGPLSRVVACDRDLDAVGRAKERLAEFGERATVVHTDFEGIEAWLEQAGLGQVDGLVADLGISSFQLDDGERGMSFRFTGPLDMRMDQSRGPTALELIESLSQDELADVIYQLGEERRSRRVARCIKQAEEAGELATTADLRRAVVRAVGPRRVGGVDPATKTFQALRIAVNDELGQLKSLMAIASRVVKPGGLAAFISFHSLEDRIVKRAFMERETWERLTKKPLLPSDEERTQNPRARSAKLRVGRRIDDTEPELGFGSEEDASDY
ncbi:MAG: 16S rRNA (cytosine(1402)-N(4))-methyltransferase RsmH [Polyangiaceae bacterium]|nr:16S rRNA (cytosine(1402)-N(4))-methyltransferase RsmH [Myxococcales bacterium]MCB9588794.1 16S rRNA (cytosine(1402)-N(4))-methyltransferase RsmH [Polyangiaceae bacterium]MCB9605353.1 16S rRNA (cytosine(1402)-N(4))-methyltransferase RsmH [Polyangiaceae bacterium]